MILNGESRFSFYAESLNSLIVEIDMCHFNRILLHGHCFGRNTKSVILACDLRSAGDGIEYRMVDPSVPVVHLIG